MAAEINRGKEAEEPEYVHGANHAEVEFAVVESCLRRDFHSAPVRGRIGECGVDGWPKLASWISIAGDTHRKWREAQKFAWSRERVSATCSEPLGQIVGPTCNFSINRNPSNAAEIMLTWCRRLACHFSYHSVINTANINSGIELFRPGGERCA